MSGTERPEPRRRRRALALLLLLAVLAVVLYLLLSGGSSGPAAPPVSVTATGTTQTGPPATGTATVQRRDLTVTTTVAGRLDYGRPQTVLDYLTGTITALAPVGQVIRAGQTLFSIDHTPVVLLSGSVAATRALTPEDSAGPDIYELNANLVALGYGGDPVVVNDEWQPATTLAVKRLQAHLGEPQTGELPLGYAVFLPGPQIVEAREAAVGGYAAAGSPPAPSSGPSAPSVIGSDYKIGSGHQRNPAHPSQGRTELIRSRRHAATATTVTFTTQAAPDTTTTAAGDAPTTPGATTTAQAVTTTAPTATSTAPTVTSTAPTITSTAPPVKINAPAPTTTAPAVDEATQNEPTTASARPSQTSVNATGSDAAASPPQGLPVLSTASTALLVNAKLSPRLSALATVGRPVTVTLPDGSIRAGKISAVTTAATGAAVPITITLSVPLTGPQLNKTVVHVGLVTRAARNALSIPTRALTRGTDNRPAVRIASSGKLLNVKTGIVAGGYVAVSGPGIHQGLAVETFG